MAARAREAREALHREVAVRPARFRRAVGVVAEIAHRVDRRGGERRALRGVGDEALARRGGASHDDAARLRFIERGGGRVLCDAAKLRQRALRGDGVARREGARLDGLR